MAAALAERQRDQRGMDINIITGGVDPADSLHEEIIIAMEEVGIDISGRIPRRITPGNIEDVDHVVTMGCSTEKFHAND